MIVREATAADARAVAQAHVASWRAAYRGIIDEDFLHNLSVDDKQSYWLQWFMRNEPSRFMRVIDDDARAVGFAVGGPARGRMPSGPARRSLAAAGAWPLADIPPLTDATDEAAKAESATVGEVYVLYLLPEVQRRGWGTQLMRSMARGLRQRGSQSMLLWVLQRNHAACRFYEALGGQPLYRRRTEVGRQQLVEIGYVWDDLSTLAAPVPAR